MKRSELFVEVDCEEVEVPCSSLEDVLVVSEDIVEVVRSFSSNWSDLLIASCISWYEKDWNSLDLWSVSIRLDKRDSYITIVSSSTVASRYRYTEYLLAKRVCSVSKSLSLANAGLIYDIRHPLQSNCRVVNE